LMASIVASNWPTSTPLRVETVGVAMGTSCMATCQICK
jgi:hypothetical protein